LTYTIIDITRLARGGEARVLEEIEDSRVLFEAYEGAIFIHQGLTFLVQEMSHDSRTVRVVRTDVNWTTKPRDFTNYDAVRTYRIREVQGTPHRAFYGRIDVKTVIFGYFKLRHGKILDAVDLESPPFERETNGFWFDVPPTNLHLMKRKGLNPAEAIHAACHAILNRFDLGHHLRTECKIPQKEYQQKPSQRKRPAR
jgi:DEAD/DEAH box helicase domain-containing protein